MSTSTSTTSTTSALTSALTEVLVSDDTTTPTSSYIVVATPSTSSAVTSVTAEAPVTTSAVTYVTAEAPISTAVTTSAVVSTTIPDPYDVYRVLAKRAEFYSLWMSYEMLLAENNETYLRTQAILRDKEKAKNYEAAEEREYRELKESESKAGKPNCDERERLAKRANISDELRTKTLARFVITEGLAEKCNEALKISWKYFEDHYNILRFSVIGKIEEPSLRLVSEPISAPELTELVHLLRLNHQKVLDAIK